MEEATVAARKPAGVVLIFNKDTHVLNLSRACRKIKLSALSLFFSGKYTYTFCL